MTAVEHEVGVEPPESEWRRLLTIPALDGIRGLAVTLVVTTHLKLLLPYGVTGVGWIDGIVDGSYLGVDLFFVLSGFLITALLLNELQATRTVRFGAFYARRALRLLPALYFLLAAHAVYAHIADLSSLQEWATIRSAALYVSNWQVVFRPLTAVPSLGLLWSLAIEEQFYLLWPAILVTCFGLGRRVRTVAVSLCLLILAVALWRAHLWEEGTYWAQLAVRTDTRLDALLVGALLASLWVRGATPTRGVNALGWLGLGTVVACVATFDITTGFGYKGGLTLYAVAVAGVILALVHGSWAGRWFFDLPPLRAVGRVSYGLYLWHYPVFYAFSVHGVDLSNVERVSYALLVTAAGTLLSWYVIERPALRLKSRFRPARAVLGSAEHPVPFVDVPPSRPLPRWDSSNGKAFWAAATVGALVAIAVVVRFTVLVDDPPPAPEDAGLVGFPVGDVDRAGYWRLVDLEATLSDDFDRPDDPADIGTTTTGQPWTVVSGTWGVVGGTAAVSSDTGTEAALVIAPQVVNDGLVEVTLAVVADGAGLAFLYQDPANYWSVTASGSGSWEVIQVIDGVGSAVGSFPAPDYDGVTVSITQNGGTIRVLVDGLEHFRLLDPPPTTVLGAGLVADGDDATSARWDRFLLLAPETAPGIG